MFLTALESVSFLDHLVHPRFDPLLKHIVLGSELPGNSLGKSEPNGQTLPIFDVDMSTVSEEPPHLPNSSSVTRGDVTSIIHKAEGEHHTCFQQFQILVGSNSSV